MTTVLDKRTTVAGVVARRLCAGCGACAVACPSGAVALIEGRRFNHADVDASLCANCGLCLAVCPMASAGLAAAPTPGEALYLSWARDAEVRRAGASGGVVTALLARLLGSGSVDAAVVVRADDSRPLYNRAVAVTGAADVFSARGSRYAPASACLGLRDVLSRKGRVAFVGKPCEIAAVRALEREVPALSGRIALRVGIFCAQTPARSRTEALIAGSGVALGDVRRVDYRGPGWPGTFRVTGAAGTLHSAPYDRAWSFLAAGKPSLACFLCGDLAASRADVSVGDPWGADPERVGDGASLVAALTPEGAAALHDAERAGAVEIEPAGEALASRLAGRRRLREDVAACRLAVYRALFDRPRSFKAAAANRLSGLPTLLTQRLRPDYY